MVTQHLAKVFSVLESENGSSKKYRIEIQMIKPYEIVDFWPKKPGIDNVLETFIEGLYSIDSSDYFKIKVSEVHDDNAAHSHGLHEKPKTIKANL